MPLVLNQASVRIELTTPGEWVDVKSRLSKGDMARIEAAAFKLRAQLKDATPELDMTMDYEATMFVGLEVGIVKWSFEEPLTPENLRALDPDDYDLIADRVNELWESRSDDEKGNSLRHTPMPLSAQNRSQRRSAG